MSNGECIHSYRRDILGNMQVSQPCALKSIRLDGCQALRQRHGKNSRGEGKACYRGHALRDDGSRTTGNEPVRGTLDDGIAAGRRVVGGVALLHLYSPQVIACREDSLTYAGDGLRHNERTQVGIREGTCLVGLDAGGKDERLQGLAQGEHVLAHHIILSSIAHVVRLSAPYDPGILHVERLQVGTRHFSNHVDVVAIQVA